MTRRVVAYLAIVPVTVTVRCKVNRFDPRVGGSENDPRLYTNVYGWTTTINAAAGEHWQRFAFPALERSTDRWYAFEIQLLEPRPIGKGAGEPDRRAGIGIVASADNPARGGKLWIDAVRQPGSLFLRAEGSTMYERFAATVEPNLPRVFRYALVQIAIGLVSLWALVTAIDAVLLGRRSGAGSKVPFQIVPAFRRRSWHPAVADLIQIVALSVALAMFFAVPDSPAASIPLMPELLLIGTLCIIAGLNKPSTLQPAVERLSPRQTFTRWWILPALWIGYTTVRAIHGGLPASNVDPCFAVAPSAIVRWECRLQASFQQNYGFRSFVEFAAMIAIGGLGGLMSRRIGGFWRTALAAILFVGVAHALIGFAARWFWIPQVLPPWIMVNSYEFDRFTYLIPHPGYVWPQLAPAFAVAACQSMYGTIRSGRVGGLAAAVLLGSAICSTRQRGGLLLVGTIAFVVIAALVVEAIRHSSGKITYSMIRLSVGGAIVVMLFYPVFVSWSQWGGQFIDSYRLTLWKFVWSDVVREHAFFGFGYARWPEFARLSAGTAAAAVLDTAHSTWIRVLFELGTVGLALLGACVFLAVFISLNNAQALSGGVFLILTATIAFAICRFAWPGVGIGLSSARSAWRSRCSRASISRGARLNSKEPDPAARRVLDRWGHL